MTIDTARWAVADLPPHRPAPELVPPKPAPLVELALPASRRLPHDSVDAVNIFYDFVRRGLAPAARLSPAAAGTSDPVGAAVELLASGSLVAHRSPARRRSEDHGVAELAALVAARLANRGGMIRFNGRDSEARPGDVSLVATHRRITPRTHESLPAKLALSMMVNTPERWQGLERPLWISRHPPSLRITKPQPSTSKPCPASWPHATRSA